MTNNITTTVFVFHSHLFLFSCTSFLLLILSLRFYSVGFKHALEMHPDILDLAVSTLHYVSWVGQTGSPSSHILLTPMSLSCSSGKPHTSWPGDMPASRPCRGPCHSISAHVHSLFHLTGLKKAIFSLSCHQILSVGWWGDLGASLMFLMDPSV